MKSQTPQQEDFDFQSCQFEVRLKKKKMFGFSDRFVYLKDNKMIICKKAYNMKNSKFVELSPFDCLSWQFDKNLEQKSFHERTTGFMIFAEKQQNEEKPKKLCEFYGEKGCFTQLRKYFALYLFEDDFNRDFNVIQKIGRGKYAKVYEIKDKITGQQYAAKYLNKKKLQALGFGKNALQLELEVLRKVQNKYCVQLHRMYEDDESYYIITELLNSKRTLQEELTKFEKPVFSNMVVQKVLSQLLKGIAYIHAQGIMHRDLKPSNIMFADKNDTTLNQLKIIDFGLAEYISAKKYVYTHVGTPGFVAPEILANDSEDHTYDEKCDIFSIGVILHILLTGKSVFPGKKFNEVLQMNQKCNISFTGEKYAQVSQDGIDLMRNLLKSDPKLRYSAEQALQHPFLKVSQEQQQTKGLKKQNSQTNLDNQLVSQNDVGQIGQSYAPKKGSQIPLTQEEMKLAIQQLKYQNEILTNDHQKQMLYNITKKLIDVLVDISYNRNINFKLFLDEKSPFKQSNSLYEKFAEKEVPKEIKEIKQQELQQDDIIEESKQNDMGDANLKPISPDFFILMNYFPKEIIQPFIQRNLSISEMKYYTRELGLFLLFGIQDYKKNNLNHLIQRRIIFIRSKKIFTDQFLDILNSMVIDDINKRIDLVDLQQQLNKLN